MVVPVTARRNNDAERQQRQQRDGFHCASFPQEKSAQWSRSFGAPLYFLDVFGSRL
jgi:hypothetical protein